METEMKNTTKRMTLDIEMKVPARQINLNESRSRPMSPTIRRLLDTMSESDKTVSESLMQFSGSNTDKYPAALASSLRLYAWTQNRLQA